MLFGYFYGAVLALETALTAPERVPLLAVYEPPLPITYSAPDIAAVDAALAPGEYEHLLLQASAAAGGFSSAKLAALRRIRCGGSRSLRPRLSLRPAGAGRAGPDGGPLRRDHRADHRYHQRADYILQAADLLTAVIPGPTRKTLPGQGHHVDPAVPAEALASSPPAG
ncbi:hypothetical protein AB0H00_09590 [Nocardia sp. NPDC023852]|uniref:hypothetical protein n=1 Tax=Nocardia sp. NPDC023852 TaxID=3154697 RepID=UPI0033FC3551